LRFHLGNLAQDAEFRPEERGWHSVRGPGSWLGYALAGLVGLAIPFALVTGLVFFSSLGAPSEGAEPYAVAPAQPWGAMLLALLVSVPAHELLHALCQPRWGLSDRTVVVMWPAKLRFGVYYEGCISRTRWLIMRLVPLVVLSLLPAALLAVFSGRMRFSLETFLAVLMLVNGIGSGGDVIAVAWVAFQVPPSALLCFHRGGAYWKPEYGSSIAASQRRIDFE
jgi:hypothetical protein